MNIKTIPRMRTTCTLTIAAVLAFSALGLAQAYKQTNLDSDIQGLAQNPPNGQSDAQLVNPWGIIASPTSPWWSSSRNNSAKHGTQPGSVGYYGKGRHAATALTAPTRSSLRPPQYERFHLNHGLKERNKALLGPSLYPKYL